MLNKTTLLARRLMVQAVRNSSHSAAGYEGLPFPVGNPVKVTAAFILFFAPPFWAPWLITRYQMLKK